MQDLSRTQGDLRSLLKISGIGTSHRGTAEMDPTRNYEVAGSIPGLSQWVKDPAVV